MTARDVHGAAASVVPDNMLGNLSRYVSHVDGNRYSRHLFAVESRIRAIPMGKSDQRPRLRMDAIVGWERVIGAEAPKRACDDELQDIVGELDEQKAADTETSKFEMGDSRRVRMGCRDDA